MGFKTSIVRSNSELSLENDLRALADKLEDVPDGWFDCPNGWLCKPNFDRKEQDSSYIMKHPQSESSKRSWFGSSYSKYFFVLETRHHKIKYYKDSRMLAEKGSIDLSTVTGIVTSKVFDAPQFSIDLVTPEKHYTLAAESQQDMIRWAFAVNHAKSLKARQVPDKTITSENRFHRFEVTFPVKTQLHLNVMGSMNRNAKNGQLVKHWMVVVGFERTESGASGVAEQCGKIMKKDFIEAVNGTDISSLTFDEAMDLISKANWPLTLRFLRDKKATVLPSEIEGWHPILYPSLNRRRRRYVDLREGELSFRKPAPGGAAMFHREAFFVMAGAAAVHLIQDLTLPEEQQYVVRIICKPEARLSHLDDKGDPMGDSRVNEFDLFFKKASVQEMWSIKLSESTSPHLPVVPLRVISSASSLSPRNGVVVPTNVEENGQQKSMAIWNDITCRFAARVFFVQDGCLCWHRPSTAKNKARKVMLVDDMGGCKLLAVEAVEDQHEPSPFKFQIKLTLQDWSDTLVVGIQDEESLGAWLTIIRDTVGGGGGGGGKLIIPTQSVPAGNNTKHTVSQRAGDEEHSTSTRFSLAVDHPDLTEGSGVPDKVLEGYLFKKSEKARSSLLQVRPYNKRWFVLRDTELLYYKTRLQADSGERPSGSIQIRHIFNVREADDPSAPENAIEIGTPSRTYLMVAEDEEWQSRWLEALGDVLEAREEIIADNAQQEEDNGTAARSIAKTILHKGLLQLKGSSIFTQQFSWKEYFFVLTPGALTYYEREADVFDEDSDCVAEIGLIAITSVETLSTTSQRNQDGHIFEIRCNVKKGGDALGQKTFTLDARSGDNALNWMKIICDTTKSLELVPKENGFPGYVSVVSEQHSAEVRKNVMMKRFHAFGVGAISVGGPSSAATDLLPPSPSASTPTNAAAMPPISPAAGSPSSRPMSLLPGGRGPSFRRGGGRANAASNRHSTSSYELGES
eukprot:gene91-124_t